MSFRLIAAALGLAALTSGTALAASDSAMHDKPMHHTAKMHHAAAHSATTHAGKPGKGSATTTSRESSVDALNAQSLSAAQSGQSFAPGSAPAPVSSTPAPTGKKL